MSKKIFCLRDERTVTDEEYNDFKKFLEASNYGVLKDFKRQMYNSEVKCKKCGNKIKDMILTGMLGCPHCYETILKEVEKGKFTSSLISSDIVDFFMNKRKEIYKGKRPEYTKSYYSDLIKIADLKKELEHCIEDENFAKCEVLRYTIEDLEKKQEKFRRKING